MWRFAFLLCLCAFSSQARKDDDPCAAQTDLLEQGRCYYKLGSHAKAVMAYEKAGDSRPRALSDLGWHYFKGLGCERNVTKAAETWKKAATAGDAEAALNLGLSYRDGVGFETNPGLAMQWLQHAAAAKANSDVTYPPNPKFLTLTLLSRAPSPRTPLLAWPRSTRTLETRRKPLSGMTSQGRKSPTHGG